MGEWPAVSADRGASSIESSSGGSRRRGPASHHGKATPSPLLLRLIARSTHWLTAWWERRKTEFQRWREARAAAHQQPQRMHFEALEPRVLMSADLNPAVHAFVGPTVADVQQTTPTSHALAVNLTPVTDPDGTVATVVLTGPGSATLTPQGSAYVLALTGTDATSKLTLTTTGGDGRIALAGLTADSALADAKLGSADLNGAAHFAGTLGSLTLGKLQGASLTLAGNGDTSLKTNDIHDSVIHAGGVNLSLVADSLAASTAGASSIEAAGLKSFAVTGNSNADVKLSGVSGGTALAGYVLGAVKVDGALNGVWSVHGRASAINAGSTGAGLKLNVNNTLVQFVTKGDASGNVAVAGLQLLQVGGSARNLTLQVGADLGDDAALGGSAANADNFKAGTLARVRVTGDIVDSKIFVSIDPVNGVLGDGDDVQVGTVVQRVQEFAVGGTLQGNTSVIAPMFPAVVRIGGQNLSPGTVPGLGTTPSDTVPPVVTARLRTDSGSSANDGLTSDATVAIQYADASAPGGFQARLGSNPFAAITPAKQPDGSYLLSVAQLTALNGGSLPDAAYSLDIFATDLAGNQSTTTTLAFTLDTTAPGASAFGLDPASDTGTAGDNSTTAAIVKLVGLAEAGAAISLRRNSSNTIEGTTTAANDGSFSFDGIALPTLGANGFTLILTDRAGNTQSNVYTFTRENTTAGDNAAPSLTGALLADTGRSATDGITKDATVTGFASDNVGVTQLLAALDASGTPVYTDITARLQPDTSFTLTPAQLASLAGGTLADGSHTLRLVAKDTAGNSSAPVDVAFTLDTAAPSGASFGLSQGDAVIGTDDQTTSAVVQLRGTAEVGSIVSLASQNLSAQAGKGDVFLLPGVSLALGDNPLTLTITDAAGNSQTVTRTLSRMAQTQADQVLVWNNVALQAILRDVTDPPVATRILAIQSVAVYDALAAIEGTPAFLVQRSVTGTVSVDAATAYAAYEVLYQLYPGQRDALTQAIQTSLATIPEGDAKTASIALGRDVADAVLAIRASDGYLDFDTDDGGTAVGQWRPVGPMFLVAQDPQWKDVTPFVMTSPDEFRAPPPPALDSAEYADSINEVQSLGSATSSTRTADQTQQALFWQDGGGSYTPPGHWNQIAAQVAAQKGNSLSANARLMAELNVALADAAIACWDTKYTYDAWRPVTAIQNADVDGNDATTQDANWRSLLINPPHPDYASGHSTFSAAAAGVLAATFGDDTAFSTTSVTLPGVTRNFTSFSQAANEAGMSRIYGGIHTPYANAAGQAIGDQVAAAVLARFDLTEDTQAPSVVLATTKAVTNANLTLTGQVLDNLSGVVSAQWRLDDGDLQPFVFDATGRFTLITALLLDGPQDGGHTLTLIAKDAAGNISAGYSRSFMLDTKAPVLTLASVADGDLLTVATRLTGSGDPTGGTLAQLTYSVDGGTARNLIFDATTGAFDEALALGNLGIGNHTLSLSAADAAGNITTLSRAVTLDALAPFTVTKVTPSAGSGDVGTTFRPQVYFARAVDPTTLTAATFYATGPDGSVLPTTLVPASDGSFVWMFFNGPMPGASQVTLHLKGSSILAAQGGTLLDADGNGTAGGDLSWGFTTVSTSSVLGATLVGKVVDPGPDLEPMTFDDIRRGPDGIIHTADDQFLNPIVHAKVFIVGRPDLFTYTDAQGNFSFTDVPVGDVKVGVDGRTATNAPAGVFWPEMVMDVTLRPGIENTLMGGMGTRENQDANFDRREVYLPRVRSSSLQSVSNNVPTTITVDDKSAPGLTDEQRNQLTLTVNPGTAVGSDGRILTDVQIGISTVPSELVKDMLPPGVLQHTFDITIQAPGVDTFTEPVQITFPNVFNAAAGTKLNIISFDHTTGRLVINGTATVSQDGKYVVSDEGSGILSPGWHGLAALLASIFEDIGRIADCIDANSAAAWNAFRQTEADLVSTTSAVISTIQLAANAAEAFTPVAVLAFGASVALGTVTQGLNILQDQLSGGLGHVSDSTRTQNLLFLDSIVAGASLTPAAAYGALLIDAVNVRESWQSQFTQARDADIALQKFRELVIDCLAMSHRPAANVSVDDELAGDPLGSVVQTHTVLINTDRTIRSILQLVEGLATTRQVLSSAPTGDITDPVIIAQLKASVGSIAGAISEMEADGATTPLDILTPNALKIEELRQAFYSVLSPLKVQIPNVLYSVQSLDGTVVLRGVTDNSGNWTGSVAPNSRFQTFYYDRASGQSWSESFLSGASSSVEHFTRLAFNQDSADSDHDGLSDIAETAIGTSSSSADTDQDGVSDLAEVLAGLDSLGGRPVATGVVASLALRGETKDLMLEGSTNAAESQFAYAATGSYGLAVIDAGQFQHPIVLSQLDLPGDATDVAVDSQLEVVAVASNVGGLHLIGVSDKTNPSLVRTIDVAASQVEVLSGVVYAAVGSEIRSYDMLTGERLDTARLGAGALLGLAREGSTLYVLDSAGRLTSVAISEGEFTIKGSITLAQSNGRLFVGGGIAYVAAGNGTTGGFSTVDVSDAGAPRLLSGVDANNVQGSMVVANGSGLGIAVGTVRGPQGQNISALDVLNVSDPTNTANVVTRINLPADPFSVRIGAGIAFVANGTAGLQVVNYRSFDNLGRAPTLNFTSSVTDLDPAAPSVQVQEGTRITVTPTVSDDVQVRNVELLVNGQVVGNDVSFPFQLSAVLPTLAQNGSSVVTLQVRATDTGGNKTTSAPLVLDLQPDTTPPTVTAISPTNGALRGTNEFSAVRIGFSEAIDAATPTVDNIRIIPVGKAGVPLVPTNLQVQNQGRSVELTFDRLPVGDYELVVDTEQITDIAGNTVSTPRIVNQFSVIAETTAGDITGRIDQDTVWADTSKPYRITGNLEIAAGATLSILNGVQVIVDPGVNNASSRITVNGTLAIDHADSFTFVRRFATTLGLTVNGTLSAINTQFLQNVVDDRSTLSLDVAAGGHLTATKTLFDLPTVSLADGSVLEAGDLTNNQFRTTLVVPVTFVPLLDANRSFGVVSIRAGVLATDMTWKPLGTDTTAGMSYTLNGPFRVADGVTLTIAAGTVLSVSGDLTIDPTASMVVGQGARVVVDPGVNSVAQRITVNGTLELDDADSFTFVRRFATTLGLTVNGTLRVTSTKFTQNVVDDRSTLSLDVAAGGHLIASDTLFDLPTVSLADGSVLKAGDLTDNQFKTTLVTPALFVPLLENNKQFQAVQIRGGTLTQDVTFKPMGTLTSTGMYYLFTDSFTVQEGVTLTVAPGVALVVDPGVNSVSRRITVNGSLVLDHAQSLTFVRRFSTTLGLTVNGTLSAINTQFLQNVVDDRSTLSLDVAAGGHLTATKTLFDLPTVSLADGSVLEAGDLTNNQFRTTLVVPVTFVPLLDANRSFGVVSIRAGVLATDMTWKPLGTDTTSGMSYTLNGPFRVADGVTLTIAAGTVLSVSGDLTIDPTASMVVGQGARVVVDPGVNSVAQRITVNGTLELDDADSFTFVRRFATTLGLTVNGTLRVTSTKFTQNVVDDRSTLSLDVAAGGHLIASDTLFDLPTVSLADGSVLKAGDLTDNQFKTTLVTPALFVPLLENNKQFQAVQIRGGTLTQDVTFKPMGTLTSTGMYYLFTDSFTVQEGVTLTVAPGVALVVDPGVNSVSRRITVNGSLVLDHAQSLTFVRRFSTTLGLTVNGTLSAINTQFLQNVVDDRSTLSLDVAAGGHLTATKTLFDLPTVSLADGSVLEAGDLTDNQFKTTLVTPALFVPLLENNKQFQAVQIRGGTLTQDVTFKPMGTLTSTGMYYLFTDSFTVQEGVTLTVAPGVALVVDPGVNSVSRRITVNGSLVLDHAQSLTFVRRFSTTLGLTVNGTLSATNTQILQNVVDDRSTLSLDVAAGGHLTATKTLFDMPTLTLASGSVGSIRLSTLKTGLQIGGPSTVEIKFDNLTDATVVASGDAASTIDMRENWWGTTDPVTIENKITHRPDLAARPLVDFGGLLSAPPQVPDLTIQDFSLASDQPLVPGGSYMISFRVENESPGVIASPTAAVFYLSTSGDLAEDPLVLGITAVPALSGNGSSGSTAYMITLPPASDPWWVSHRQRPLALTMLVDGLNQVTESNESNNSRSVEVVMG